MQISVDVHNYMETLVGQLISQPNYVDAYDQDQLADIACVALGQLKPMYIRHDIDLLASLSPKGLEAIQSMVQVAVDNAEEIVTKGRSSKREEELPIIFSQSQYDGTDTLDWFEKPFLKTSKDES